MTIRLDGPERLRRVAMISLHTSPLDQPGTGDAGGMNVYVIELARRLAERDIEVDIFTRSTSSQLPPVVEAADGVRVHHIAAGPFEGLTKDELPGQLCAFAREVLRTEASHAPGYYDLVHSHYWLSGQVGALARDRWGVPLAHSMHTMAKVKNAALAEGDTPEPLARVIGEEQVVAAADMLVANTDDEARQLVDLYDADATRVEVVHPGVDLDVFRPTSQAQARARLGLAPDGHLLTFVGRIQPLKAPDMLLRAAAELVARDPSLRSTLTVAVVGGPSGTGLERPDSLARLAASLGIVRRGPVRAAGLAGRSWSTGTPPRPLVCVPSYNESFGLVAVEAQAVGHPGGRRRRRRPHHRRPRRALRPARQRARPGRLRPGVRADRAHARPARRAVAGSGGARGQQFGWDLTADRMIEVYRRAAQKMRQDLLAARA